WLPAAPEHEGLTVEEQEADAGSTLALARRLIAARQGSAALRLGQITFREVAEPVLAFEREHEGERVLCAFGMSGDPVALPDEGETLIEQGGAYAFRVARL